MLHSDFLSEGLAKAMCAQISDGIMSHIPRIDDYQCPVCYDLAYVPVRLACTHLFCIRCVCHMQRQRKKHCPTCRAETLLIATDLNIDEELRVWMEKYFRKEAEEKNKYNMTVRGKEMFGDDYIYAPICRNM